MRLPDKLQVVGIEIPHHTFTLTENIIFTIAIIICLALIITLSIVIIKKNKSTYKPKKVVSITHHNEEVK